VRRGVAPLAALIIVMGAAGGFLVAHLTGHHGNDLRPDTAPPAGVPARPAASDPAEVNGSANADPGTGGKRPIPTLLPDITLPDANGTRHRLSEWRGHLLLINFWATWCEPCRREIPLLKRLRREHAQQGVEVVGVAVDFRDAVQKYARDMGIDYPVLVGEQDGLDAINAFGMDAVFPFTVFADRQGRIITLKVGELHAEDARLILDRIEAVDQGRISASEARAQITDGMATLAFKRAQAEAQPAPAVQPAPAAKPSRVDPH
jgi:thiol-disulfide isomerase/thioredoxin